MWKLYRRNCHADVLRVFDSSCWAPHKSNTLLSLQRHLESRLVMRPAVMPVALMIAWIIHIVCQDGWWFIGLSSAAYVVAVILFFAPLLGVTNRLSNQESTYYWDQMYRCFTQESWTWLTYCGVPLVFLLNFTLLGMTGEAINHTFMVVLTLTVAINLWLTLAVANRAAVGGFE